MRSQIILFLSIVLISMAFSGCGGGGGGNNNTTPVNTAGANDNSVMTKTNNSLETKKNTPEPTTNNAPTLTPVFKAYCDAKVKGDEAALRNVYSQDTIKYFETQMKADKVKSLVKFLDDDKVTGKLCEARNEVITGDTAVAEIKADSYPNGIKIVFVKEGGEWKMTNRSPALDSVKPSASNSNSTK